MGRGDEKRARIIADQAAREEAERAAGKGPAKDSRRSNWAASRSPRGWAARPKPKAKTGP